MASQEVAAPVDGRRRRDERQKATRQPAGQEAREWPLATKAAAVAATQQSTKRKGAKTRLSSQR